jgi:hypothetical protein
VGEIGPVRAVITAMTSGIAATSTYPVATMRLLPIPIARTISTSILRKIREILFLSDEKENNRSHHAEGEQPYDK